MGAELYVATIHNAATKEHEMSSKDWFTSIVSKGGYFRDPYNEMNVLATLGMDWRKDVVPLCTKKKVELKGENLKLFRKRMATAKQQIPSTKELGAPGVLMTDYGITRMKEWRRYFLERRAELLEFLDRAIKLKSPIYCSF